MAYRKGSRRAPRAPRKAQKRQNHARAMKSLGAIALAWEELGVAEDHTHMISGKHGVAARKHLNAAFSALTKAVRELEDVAEPPSPNMID